MRCVARRRPAGRRRRCVGGRRRPGRIRRRLAVGVGLFGGQRLAFAAQVADLQHPPFEGDPGLLAFGGGGPGVGKDLVEFLARFGDFQGGLALVEGVAFHRRRQVGQGLDGVAERVVEGFAFDAGFHDGAGQVLLGVGLLPRGAFGGPAGFGAGRGHGPFRVDDPGGAGVGLLGGVGAGVGQAGLSARDGVGGGGHPVLGGGDRRTGFAGVLFGLAEGFDGVGDAADAQREHADAGQAGGGGGADRGQGDGGRGGGGHDDGADGRAGGNQRAEAVQGQPRLPRPCPGFAAGVISAAGDGGQLPGGGGGVVRTSI